jgi:type IV secretion system protein VirB9
MKLNTLARTGVLLLASLAPAASVTETPLTARVVSYGERDVIAVKAKIRFTTVIILPKREQILDYTCGDKEFWIVNGSQNLAYVKPAKEGARTDLNLITASGNVYSFVLSEISNVTGTEPDMKIFVEPKDESMLSAINGAPRFVAASQVEEVRRQVEQATAEAQHARQSAAKVVEREQEKFRAEYPLSLRFPYRFEPAKPPFNVTAIYTDGKFTYIQAHPDEPPALYQLKDGKPDLVQYEFHDGTYVATGILESGYLAVGKQKLSFIRQEPGNK